MRHDKVDKSGRVTVRYRSKLYHVGLGAAYKRQPNTLLIADRDIRVLADDGSLIRALTLDPTRNYQPLGTPSGPPRVVRDVLRHHIGWGVWPRLIRRGRPSDDVSHF